MNTFRYDSTSIEYFDSQDLGSIGDAPTSTVDRGTNFFDLIVEDGTAGVVNNEFIVETGTDFIVDDVTATENYNLIVWTETTYPFGNINVSGGEGDSAGVVFVAIAEPIVLREKAIVITKQAWTGSGTLFEIANGLERKVAPYIGGSGPLRIFGAVQDSATFDFTEESLKTYGSDADYGQVTAAVGSSVEYGQIASVTDDGETDLGDILPGEGTPFGSLKLIGIQVTSNRFRAYRGSGSFSVLSGGVDQLEEPVGSQTYIVGRDLATGQFIRNDVIGLTFSGGNPEAFARVAYQGSGSLFELSGGLESKVYDYNSGSIATFSVGTDAGDINTVASATEDYGQVASQSSGDTDHGQLILTQTRQPLTGLFKLTGGDIAHSNPRAFAGSGAFKTYKGKAVVNAGQASDFAFLPHWRSRGGITITNHIIPDRFARTHVGSGSLFEVGQKDERAVFSYQSDTGIDPSATLGTLNYGSVDQSATNTENYGAVAQPSTGDTSYGDLIPYFTKFGTLNITGGDRAHANPRAYHGSGLLNATGGRATVQFAEPAVQVYTYGSGEKQTSIGEFLKLGGGMSQLKVVKGSWIGSGSLNNSGKNDEKAVFDYTQTSIAVVQDPVDNGAITTSATTTADYGAVAQPSTGDTIYGSITNVVTNNPFGKLFEWTGGDDAHTNPRAYLGATAEISISGGYSNLKFVSQAGESTALFDIANAPGREFNTYAQVRPFIASGSLFSHGVKTERATVAYNESSIAESFTFTDAGSIGSTSTTSVDYGQISNPVPAGSITDNGSVLTVTGDERPLGKLFEIQGAAIENFFPKFIWNRQSPAIRVFNEQQDPADFRFTPHWRSRHLLGTPTIRNAPNGEFNTYAQVRPFIASGSLFSHGVKVEKATVDYNSSSVVAFAPGGDYGSITNSSTTSVDYGSVTGIVTDGEFDNGQVVITETTQPLTGLYQFQGAAESQFIRGPYVTRNGILNVTGSLVERVAQADDIGGTVFVNGVGETPRRREFIGQGRLFGLGDKYERAVWKYTTESVVTFVDGGDYGSITNSSTTSIDYGDVDGIVTDGELDNGQVVITETTQPLTGLLNFKGDSENQFIRGPYVARPFGFRIFNEQQDPADFRFSPHWRARPYEQGKLTGDAETPRARDFVGTGSLFKIGDKVEKKVYRYSSASVVEFEPGSNYGSITDASTTSLDYGSTDAIATEGEIDNGQVVITQTRQPLTGLFRITGHDTGHKQTFSEVSQTVEISLSGTAVEKFTSGAGESTALFSFVGSLAESFGKGNYAGSGSLFHIGDRVEKAVFSYNTSSVVEGYGTQQYGLITDTTSATQDYGSVGSASQPPHTDHGNMVTLPGEENPFGLFRVSGTAAKREINSHLGSGSLFTPGGAAEAAVWQTPEETFLFRTSGGAIEKHVENYVGTGNIKIKEETPLAPNAAVRFRPHWRARHLLGTPKIFGAADEEFKGAYVSKGVFSRMYTHDEGNEWRRYRPSPRYVNSIYGKIGGSAFVNGDGGTRKINVYGYYGDDRDPGTSGSLFGIGGGAEARGITPPLEDTVIFTLDGTAASKFNPHWRGRPDGSPRLSGTPELVLRFNIFTNPEVAKFTFNGDAVPVRTIIHKGSGTLFSAGSSAEVVGFNPETETRAFKFSGEPIVRIRVILFQFGTLFGFGGASESRTIEVPQSTVLFVPSGTADADRTRAFEGTGSETLSGQSVERRTAAHAGSGSLFSAGGAAESRTASIPESTVLFSAAGGDQNAFARTIIGTGSTTIDGESTDSRSRIHVGSGSLFAIGGAAESATVVEESTGLFEFNGSAEPVIRTRGFAGSGSLFAIGGGVEIAAVAPESTGLFTVSGEAQAPFARTKIGAGATFVSGDSENKATRVYTGEGQLSTFGGGAEVVGFNPAEETLLYTTQGNATVVATNAFAGSGTENVSGEAVPVITLSFVGSGDLTTFGGGAESRTIDVENTTLFETRGGATESFGRGAYHGDVETTISGEATDIKLTFGNQVFGYIGRTDGQAVEKQTDDYVGSGSLFGLSSGTIVRSRDYDETGIGQQGEVVSTNLFRISGNNPGSITRITQPGTVRISMQGEAVPVLKLFSPIRIYSTII